MKKRWRRFLNGSLSFLFAITLGGCQSDENKTSVPSAGSVLESLQALEGSKNAADVQQTFSKLIASTSAAYSHSYQTATSFTVSGTSESSNGNVSHEDYQFSTATCLYEDQTLYEVLRYSASANSDPYVGIVRMNDKSTLSLSCLPVSKDESVFQSAPSLLLDYTQEDENKALKNLKGPEIENALLSEESRILAPLFGTISPACYQQPQDYSFHFEDDGKTGTLTIGLLESQKSSKEEDDAQKEDAQDQTDSVATLESQTIEITIDSETAAMTGAEMEAQFVDEDGSRKIQTSKTWITAAGSAQDIGFLKDLFAEVESRDLPIKGEFVLDMNFALPDEAKALAKQAG